MKTIIFYEGIKKKGEIIFKKWKNYPYEKEDHIFFYLKNEKGEEETICKANQNILFMVTEDSYVDD